MGEEKLTKLTLRSDESSLEIEAPPAVASAVENYVSKLSLKMDSLKEKVSKYDGKSYELDGKTYTDMDGMYKDMCGLSKKNKDMGKELDKLKARNDALEVQAGERQDSNIDTKIQEAVQAKLDLVEKAKKHLDSVDITKSNLDIKKEIVKSKGVSAEKLDSYNELQLDAMIEVFETNDVQRRDSYNQHVETISKLNGGQSQTRADSNPWRERNRKIEAQFLADRGGKK